MAIEHKIIEMADVYSRVHYAIRQEVDVHPRTWHPDELTAIQAGKQSDMNAWRVYYLPEHGYTVVAGARGGHDMSTAQLCIRYTWCAVQRRYRQV